MPSDLAAASRLVIVRDSAGLGLPFSKGLMATSILATGAETDQAYAIAAEIQRELTGRGAADIDAHELAMLAARTIEARAGAEFAARYQTWRRLRRDGRPLLLVLGGAPGVDGARMAALRPLLWTTLCHRLKGSPFAFGQRL